MKSKKFKQAIESKLDYLKRWTKKGEISLNINKGGYTCRVYIWNDLAAFFDFEGNEYIMSKPEKDIKYQLDRVKEDFTYPFWGWTHLNGGDIEFTEDFNKLYRAHIEEKLEEYNATNRSNNTKLRYKRRESRLARRKR